MQTRWPLILEPEVLAAELPALDNCLILDLSSQASYLEGHVPGAVRLDYSMLLAGTKPAPGKLPQVEQLAMVFSRLGLGPDTHVIAYDDEGGGWAGRLIWTLDMIGHPHYSYLNGGIHAWRAAELPLETEPNRPQSCQCHIKVTAEPKATLEDVLNSLDDPETVIWDARGPLEYTGEKVVAQKGGHIPGAVNFEWTQAMDPARALRIKDESVLRPALAELGLTEDKTIITHCQTHHRSGFTYLVGKALGFNIKAYDGSWSEWGNHPDTPVEI